MEHGRTAVLGYVSVRCGEKAVQIERVEKQDADWRVMGQDAARVVAPTRCICDLGMTSARALET